jgi:hypothetical protein
MVMQRGLQMEAPKINQKELRVRKEVSEDSTEV